MFNPMSGCQLYSLIFHFKIKISLNMETGQVATKMDTFLRYPFA